MNKIIKTIGKGIGKGIGGAAYVTLTTVGAAVSALWETTGDRGMMRDALSDSSSKDLMEIYEIHEKDDGDYDTYIAAKSLLQERGYTYNHETNKWENTKE
ncbi:hypothetical protein CD117_13765 [Mammaliicoccus sciuri]|uniref:Uncharacterized protein n=1 Tax=Mammaliicoccus sciuri TaxID=1296 RepID=A0AAJ4VGN0_MAMSC|nr:hypothetical protein [Mammaliicoccus sciuri]RTX70534.1 hypothetical protein CD117_13765 [Mammaliicoccus sciuri]